MVQSPNRRYWAEVADQASSATANQFGLAPENLITFAHFSVSSAMLFTNSAGEAMTGGAPMSMNRALILASARPALISRLSFSMISTGVPFGAHMPFQPLAS